MLAKILGPFGYDISREQNKVDSPLSPLQILGDSTHLSPRAIARL
jgi:hypothetical protein